MSPHILTLKETIEPVRNKLVNHKLYSRIQDVEHLHTFMQHHVFAVWDFMSLLKALQQQLTCVQVPWVPVGSGSARYLINEIVLGEESDVDSRGRRISHFELYLEAMQAAGADTAAITLFLQNISGGCPIEAALSRYVPDVSVRLFLEFTFKVIATGKPHLIAAVFTFGREELIPDMFLQMMQDLPESERERLQPFKYYLERHIEVDGDHHSHLAIEMLEELCGADEIKWEEARRGAKAALEARLGLWDGVVASLR